MAIVDLSIARRLAELPGAIVAVSGGKDATACLQLYRSHNPTGKIVGMFWYLVEGLEFQERYLRYLERRFEFRIMRLPHFFNAEYLRTAAYAPPVDAPQVSQSDIVAHARLETGLDWLILGEKKCDNPPRLWMLRKCKGWNERERKAYPVANWTHGQVFSYLKSHGVALPPEYRFGLDTSFGGFVGAELKAIKERYPSDWKKIERRFPFIEAAIFRSEAIKVSRLGTGDDRPEGNQKRPVQSADN